LACSTVHHIDVDDPRAGYCRLRDLVDVLAGGQAGAEVNELRDAAGCREPHHALHERPVGARVCRQVRLLAEELLGELPISREVVLPPNM
jgi:hypothetical protein